MDEERFASSRENPRATGFLPGDRLQRAPAPDTAVGIAQSMPPSRATPPIMDRFRAMLREREEELREAADGDSPPPLTADEIVRMYEEVLRELAFNSKPIITELTIIAGQQIQFAEGIADCICSRVLEVPVDQKLPILYLLDSIVKNIGREYARAFAARLPKVFCEAYNQVPPSQYPSMRHLFGTWSRLFPSSVLCKIECELQFSPSDDQRMKGVARPSKSPSPRLSHGIHVNPKYFEARQLQHSAVDPENSAGVSSTSKPSAQYTDYDFDQPEMPPNRFPVGRAASPQTAVRPSSMFGAGGPAPYLKSKPSSPSRISLRQSASPPPERFPPVNSSGTFSERSFPSFRYETGRVTDLNGWSARSRPPTEDIQPLDASLMYNINNGNGEQRQRDLIDAYGNPRGKGSSLERFPKVQRLEVNGITSEAATRNWKNSDEEEYVWENMSPTLADRSGRSNLPPFAPTSGSYTIRVGLTRPNPAVLEPDPTKQSWPSQMQLPVVDPALAAEESMATLGFLQSSRLSAEKYPDIPLSQQELSSHYQGYNHTRDSGYGIPYTTQKNLSSIASSGSAQSPFSVGLAAQPIGQRPPVLQDNLPETEVPLRQFSNLPTHMTMNTSSIDRLQMLQRPRSPPTQSTWPARNSQPQPLIPIPPNRNSSSSIPTIIDPNIAAGNERAQPSPALSNHQYDMADRRAADSVKLMQFPFRPPVYHHLTQNQEQARGQSHEANGSVRTPASALVTSYLVAQQRNHVQVGHGIVMPPVLFSSSSMPSVAVHSMPGTSVNLHSGLLPSLPPGPHNTNSQIGPISLNTGASVSSSPANAYSGLISSLMVQGVFSKAPAGVTQEPSLGLDFNIELIKVRHESAINALYSDLPRQCTTCGLRFKGQEEHRTHMDWHVTKNRISRNRKQKPSRKLFVSAKEWLSGAEILGNDVVPGFLPTEPVIDEKEDKEMAVPADENQNVCALCGEPFEDFFSDETDEWMYKGAIYLNAPDGLFEGIDRTQLGPIVHAKCRSEST